MSQPGVLAAAVGLAGAAALYLLRSRAQRAAGPPAGAPTMRVTGLFYYPIKSCAAVPIDAAEITPTGLRHDRQWMLVDAKGRFLTQRKAPKMALVEARVLDDGHRLQISAPGAGSLDVPWVTDADAEVQVQVWDSVVRAHDQGDAAAAFFADFLGLAGVRLVKFAPDHRRATPAKYSRDGSVGFADGFPYLFASERSLADLNERLDGPPVPMDRFRPNVVIDGPAAPFAEDQWRTVEVAGLLFDFVKPCTRCKMPTNDQATGEFAANDEPRATLNTFRRGDQLGFEAAKGIYFGQNAVCKAGAGRVAVGDEMVVVR